MLNGFSRDSRVTAGGSEKPRYGLPSEAFLCEKEALLTGGGYGEKARIVY